MTRTRHEHGAVVDEAAVGDAARQDAAPAAGIGTSLYVHVPFCVVKCGYCDFNSFEVDAPQAFDRFLDALAAELRARAPRAPSSVFVGGGTPTHLDGARFERLLAIVAEALTDAPPGVEITIEANPESVTADKARAARAAGVSRVSIGAQSFDPAALRFLDRAHDGRATRAAVETFRAAGFDNLGLDMIYALPGQTLEDWQRDLDALLELGPDHASCYALTYEPGTRLTHDLRRGRVEPLDADSELAMFEHTHAILGEAGYDAYEVSNFAGRGGICRHNDHYWLQGDYVGVGPGASSHRSGWRTTSLKPVETWAEAVAAGLSPAGTAEVLDPSTRAGEAIWLGLRRRDGVDLARVERATEVEVREHFGAVITAAVDEDLVVLDGARLRLTERGRPFADTVGARFLAVREARDGAGPIRDG